MPTLVKVRMWGNSLALRFPKSFASHRGIVDGADRGNRSVEDRRHAPRVAAEKVFKPKAPVEELPVKPPKEFDVPLL